MALSVASMDVGDIPVTINQKIAGATRTEALITGETYSGGDIAAGISYARQVTNRLSIGGNLRYIEETVADLSMDNISLDVGTTYYTGWRSLRLAMVARNLGADTQLAGWDETIQAEPVNIRMPIDFRVGVAMDFFEGEDSPHKLTVSVEGAHPNDGSEKLNMGMEYWWGGMVALRAGYRAGYDEETMSFGGGVNLVFGGVVTAVHYAYVPFGRLGTVNMFTINLAVK